MASSTPENQIAVSAIKLLIKSMISVVLCVGSAFCAHAQDAQRNSTDGSWTAATESSAAGQNPLRTTESHTSSGNRTVDKQTLEVLGTDGQYQPSSQTETETVRVSDTKTRTVVRTYTWDLNGQWKLTTVAEEEAQSTAGGDAHVVRTTSDADVNGNLQIVQREVADTSKAGPGAQETKITVFQTDGSGGFTAALQTEELQKQSADHTVKVNTTTRVPDGNGNWNVSEVKEKTITEDGKNRTTEEGISYADSEGKLSEVSRTVNQETETPAGEKKDTVDTYSPAVPGSSPDGSLHLTRRATTQKGSDGEITEEQVEQPNPGDPNAGLQVTAKTKYTVLYGATGTQQTRTTQTNDGNGNLNESSVETRKSDQVPPTQAETAPSDKPQ